MSSSRTVQITKAANFYRVATESAVRGSCIVIAGEDFDEVVAAVLLILNFERVEAQVHVLTFNDR